MSDLEKGLSTSLALLWTLAAAVNIGAGHVALGVFFAGCVFWFGVLCIITAINRSAK